MESVSRISSILETARDLTIEAAQSASLARSSKGGSSRSMTFAQIKKLLESRHDREILEGLRKVITMIYRTEDCLAYFSAVVKNVANQNIEVKKLVYIYLLHYAESEPDLALLSINTIQKSLNDQNPQIRAMALRTMSGIRVPVISQIVSLAIKKGCGDMSPHVRKAAALAIPKCYRLDPNTVPQLLEYLTILLGDKQYFVAGSAVAAFLEICPERIDMIHKHYRNLVRKLVDMDEWGQIATLKLMLLYSRKCFPRIKRRVNKSSKKAFYDEGKTEETDDPEDQGQEVIVLDPDLELLLKGCLPLLQSRNTAVLSGVVSCYLYLGTPDYLESAVGPLVALLRGPEDTQYIALYNIVSVALALPQAFVKYTTHFLIRSTDPPHIWKLKFEVLTAVFPHCGLHYKNLILNELEHFAHGADPDLVRESVRSIGKCAQNDERTSARCLRVLLKQVSSSDKKLVSEALTVIRYLIQQNPEAHVTTVIKLAKNLDTTTSPDARASIIWLVGEFASINPENNIAPDVLRILVKNFADETEVAKRQIVLLCAKVYLHYLQSQQETKDEAEKDLQETAEEQSKTPPQESASEAAAEDAEPSSSEAQASESQPTEPKQEEDQTASLATTTKPHPIPLLWSYILLLTRYDTSYDLRDRTRLFTSLLSNPSSTQLASLLLLAPKPVPHAPSASETRRGLKLGSATLIIGSEKVGQAGLSGYEKVPDWVAQGSEPDPSLRDNADEYDGSNNNNNGSSMRASGGGEIRGFGRNTAPSVLAASKKSISAAEMLAAQVREQGKEDFVRSGAGRFNSVGVGKGKQSEKTLDDWLAEEEDDEETESGSEEEDEESEGGSAEDDQDDEEGSSEYETDSEEEETDESDGDQGNGNGKAETKRLVR